MHLACLQYNPSLGEVAENIDRANALLKDAPTNLDLLLLPEMAFTGYNFQSRSHIRPYLEPTASGVTTKWAQETAKALDCFVVAGYPEHLVLTVDQSTSDIQGSSPPGTPSPCYNSAVLVSPSGEVLANYRKHFLYYTDETWAEEGPEGFFTGNIAGLGKVAMGICMDINPHKFTAPWTLLEFANHVLSSTASFVLLSMNWTTHADPDVFFQDGEKPDLDSWKYWITRLEPAIRADRSKELIIIIANRWGQEGSILYAGTSTIIGVKNGDINIYGMLERASDKLMVVDSEKLPIMAARLLPKDYLQ